MIKLPPWTYGWLNDDLNCPRKGQHKYVLKDLPREVNSAAQQHGINVHKAVERRLKERTPFPANMPYEKFALAFDGIQGEKLVEENLAITAQCTPTNFFGDDVWGRGRLDSAAIIGTTAILFDWKTGNPREDPLELETQAFMLKCRYPGLTHVRGHYVWLKESRVGPKHDCSDFGRIFNSVRLQMHEIENRPIDQEWTAKPNPLCGYCPVRSCAHNVNRS